MSRRAAKPRSETHDAAEVARAAPRAGGAVPQAERAELGAPPPPTLADALAATAADPDARWHATLLASIAAASPVGIYMVSMPDKRVLYFNQRLCEIWRMEHLAEPLRRGEITHADVLAHCRALVLGDALAPEGLVRGWRPLPTGALEYEVRLRDGRTVRQLSSPIRDEAGAHVATLFLDEDVTARARAEAQFRLLIEQAPDAVLVHRDGLIRYANTRAAALLAVEAPAALVGCALESFVHPDDHAALREHTRAALRDGQARERLEVRLRRRDGGAATAELSAIAIDDEDAQRVVLAFVRDVTEQRRLQAQLLQADRLALVGTLAAGVAHEINNPLTYALLNLAHVERRLAARSAAGGDAESEQLRGLVTLAREGAERVRDIVRDLKTFSRHETGERALVDVRAVVDSTVQMAMHEIEPRARLVRDYAEVPPVEANEARLAQVFLNLLLNAAQAIPPGEPEANSICVTARTEQDPPRVLVEVRDSGTGIPRAELSRVFDPFFTTKPVGVGTGLGLSICHGIVTSLGGSITLESDEGRGTTVRVALPARGG